MGNKYLKITMYDNDFTSYAREFGEYIYTMCLFECRFFDEEDIQIIKKYITLLWYSASHLHGWLRFGKHFPDTTDKENLDYFTENVKVSIVDEKDLEEHREYGNYEIIYVGMFDVAPDSDNFPNVEDYPVYIV
jgi:hypothetical protein